VVAEKRRKWKKEMEIEDEGVGKRNGD